MSSSKIPLRYAMKTYRKEQFWMPPAFLAFFCILTAFFLEDGRASSMATAFLGYMLPLITGILASSPILSDPALELHFAAPISAWRLLVARYVVLLAVILATGFIFQGCMALMGVDLAYLGNFWQRQLVWLVPSLAMLALGCFTALAFKQATSGSVFTGGLWIFELTLRGYLLSKPLLRNVVLFMGATFPMGGRMLVENQITLTLMGAVLLVLSVFLLKRQERYI
jgi:hypothetical protein